MKKLVVCGDSFSLSDKSTDWPLILAKKLNYKLINLAIWGASNINICFQIEYALKNLNPDIIIISLTAVDRFEIDKDEYNYPASFENFNSVIDEAKDAPTIISGNIISHIRNAELAILKNHLMTTSYRLSAQTQSWSIQHILNNINCKFLLYRNIFPRYHENKNEYLKEYYFGLEKILIDSGPYDYENTVCDNKNHLNVEDNILFSERVFKDLQ